MNILEKICEKKLSEIRVQKSHIEYKSKINISKRRDFLKNLGGRSYSLRWESLGSRIGGNLLISE